MKATLKSIDAFLDQKNIAVAGASSKKDNFGNYAIKNLIKKGYTVFPIHPYSEKIEDIKCYANPTELPNTVTSVFIVTNSSRTNQIIEDSQKMGISNIWIQQKSENNETENLNSNINLITGECLLMHLKPVSGMHKFHRNMKKLFGKLPK